MERAASLHRIGTQLRTTADAWTFAVRLHALDRWPVAVSDDRIWERFRLTEPFGCRWKGHPVPRGAQDAYDAIDRGVQRVANASVTVALQHVRDQRMANHRIAHGLRIHDCNQGPGGRTANTLHVAITADAHFDGASATAMPWNHHEDPVLVIDVHAVAPTIGALERAKTRQEAHARVQAWGPGAKGILSVRDPDHTFHRLLNVTNTRGRVDFLDYSRTGEPKRNADEVLRQLDGSSPFAGIQLWRTQNLPGQSRIPDDLLTQSPDDIHRHVAAAVGDRFDEHESKLISDRIRFFDDFSYAVWLIEQCRRDACTFLTGEIDARNGASVQPLTSPDRALVSLRRHGRLTRFGDEMQMVLPDTPRVRETLAGFAGTSIRQGAIDGLLAGWIEAVLPEASLESYDGPIPDATDDDPAAAPPTRGFSWVDTNRAMSPGQRKTNCWNCTAAVAHWLSRAEPTTALPIYPKSSFRPTIPQYLDAMDAGPTAFVDSRQGLEAIVRSWAPGSHGVVIASFNPSSTHMFNVVFDGESVRYLDGYIGREGDYNFDITWERLAVAPLGSVFPTHGIATN